MTREEDLGFGHLGNGLTVWDRNKNYRTVAHISIRKEITYYIENLSEDAKKEIENVAKTYEP